MSNGNHIHTGDEQKGVTRTRPGERLRELVKEWRDDALSSGHRANTTSEADRDHTNTCIEHANQVEKILNDHKNS